jgi:hypothetical protein
LGAALAISKPFKFPNGHEKPGETTPPKLYLLSIRSYYYRTFPQPFIRGGYMFCPQCGHELSSDRVRFCTKCRFPIGSIKEFIAMEAARQDHGADEEKRFSPLRQIDITVGATLQEELYIINSDSYTQVRQFVAVISVTILMYVMYLLLGLKQTSTSQMYLQTAAGR